MVVTAIHDSVTTEIVRQLRWMCVTQRRYYFMAMLMYNSVLLKSCVTKQSFILKLLKGATITVNDNSVCSSREY